MPLKINIADKGKTWKLELEGEALFGKSIGEKIEGKQLKHELEGYEFEIMGGSDSSGFPMYKNLESIGLKRVLFSKGWGMHKRPRKNKKVEVPTARGIRLKKTVRGRIISDKVIQLNIKTIKHGKKSLTEIFPEQNKKEETKVEKANAPAQEQEIAA